MVDRDDAAAYGEAWAAVYDAEHEFMDPTEAVALLTELAGGRPALELGIGTGRVALPLRERGVRVHGLDGSPAMVAELRRKPGADGVDVVIGDMASTPLGGPYGLVFVVFNTFFALLNQAQQVACFRNVAAALEPGGKFVLECFVPDVTRFRDGDQTVRIVNLDDTRVRLAASVHDSVRQVVRSRVLVFGDDLMRARPVTLRYCWPAELDLMAELAGLELVDRWAGWAREPFDSASSRHVSVYRRPGS